jgi:hypothetical protein
MDTRITTIIIIPTGTITIPGMDIHRGIVPTIIVTGTVIIITVIIRIIIITAITIIIMLMLPMAADILQEAIQQHRPGVRLIQHRVLPAAEECRLIKQPVLRR